MTGELLQLSRNRLAGSFPRFFRRSVIFQHADRLVELTLKAVNEHARTGTGNRIRRHQLRMRETLINVFINYIGFVEDQIPFIQDRNRSVRGHCPHLSRNVEHIDIANFKIHALLEEHETAAMGERIRRA